MGKKKSINTHHYKCTQKKLHNLASITVGPFTERKHMCGQEKKIEVVFWNSSKGLGKQKLILYHMLTIDRSNAKFTIQFLFEGERRVKGSWTCHWLSRSDESFQSKKVNREYLEGKRGLCD